MNQTSHRRVQGRFSWRQPVAAAALAMALISAIDSASATGAEPGWSPVIIATGEYRRQIEALPIEHRPYRPLHFYGNTVRRIYHRGSPLPIAGGNQNLSNFRLDERLPMIPTRRPSRR